MVNKYKICAVILAVVLLFSTAFTLSQSINQQPTQPTVVRAALQRLNVFVFPSNAKLEPLQPQTFSAYSNGYEPVSYMWSARATATVAVSVNNATLTLGEEPVNVAVGQEITFAYAEASEAEVCLTVKAVDADGATGYADAIVSDPFTVSNMYLSAFPTTATYIVEADGKGWYWALHRSGLPTQGTNDDDIIQYAINETSLTGGSVFIRATAYSAVVVIKNNVLLVIDYGVTGVAYTVAAGANCTVEDRAGKLKQVYVKGELTYQYNYATGTETVLSATITNADVANLNAANYNINGTQLGFKQPYTFLIDYNATSGLYQAWHGANSTLAWSSTNANAISVINSAFGNLTAGRTWCEQVVLKGPITINGTMLQPIHSHLTVIGNITLADNANCDMLRNSDPIPYDMVIEGGWWNGNFATQTGGDNYICGINITQTASAFYSDRHIHIRNLVVWATRGTAINLKGMYIYMVPYLSNVNARTGTGFGDGINATSITDFVWTGIDAGSNSEYAVEFYGCAGGAITSLRTDGRVRLRSCKFVSIWSIFFDISQDMVGLTVIYSSSCSVGGGTIHIYGNNGYNTNPAILVQSTSGGDAIYNHFTGIYCGRTSPYTDTNQWAYAVYEYAPSGTVDWNTYVGVGGNDTINGFTLSANSIKVGCLEP